MSKEQLQRLASDEEYKTIDVEAGLGIEFSDGFDVFWVLPGEVTSTIDIDPEQPIDAETIFAEFKSINSIRRDVLKVMSHYLHQTKCGIESCRNGEWLISSKSSHCGRTVYVGSTLTFRILRGDTIYQLMNDTLFWGRKLSTKQVDDLLTLGQEILLTLGEEETPRTKIKRRGLIEEISSKRWGQELKRLGNFPSPSDLKALSQEVGPVLSTLINLALLLPDARAETNWGNGDIYLQFEDGNSSAPIVDHYSLFDKLMYSLGPVGAAQVLAEEFKRISFLRKKVIAVVERTAIQRNWRKEVGRAERGPHWHYGDHYRRVKFLPGDELTHALKNLSIDEVIRSVLFDDDQFIVDCVENTNDVDAPATVRIVEAELSPLLPTTLPELVSLNDNMIRLMDEFAQEQKKLFFSDKDSIYKHRDRLYSSSRPNDWASFDDWLALAAASVEREHVSIDAIFILMDAKDPRADELAHQVLERVTFDSDTTEDEAELVWRYRQDYPELSREFFGPNQTEESSFLETRYTLGDPVAIRQIKEKHAQSIADMSYWENAELPPANPKWLSPELLSHHHANAVDWARTSWFWSPPLISKMRMALDLGFYDIPELFEQNPFILSVFFAYEERHCQENEPGIFRAKEFILAWSLLHPTPLLARIIATKVSILDFAEAQVWYEKDSNLSRLNPVQLDSARKIVLDRSRDFKLALAIAWLRCRLKQDLSKDVELRSKCSSP